MLILCRVFAVLTAPRLMGNIYLVGNYDTTRGCCRVARCRCRRRLQVLHPDIFHHPLLALCEGHADGDRIRVRSASSAFTVGIVVAGAPKPPIQGGFGCLLRRLETAAEHFREPGSQQVEDHWKISRDNGNECLSGAPFVSEFGAIIRILW